MELVNKTKDTGNFEYNGKCTNRLYDEVMIESINKIANFKGSCYKLVITLYEKGYINFYALYKNTFRETQRVDFTIKCTVVCYDFLYNIIKEHKHPDIIRRMHADDYSIRYTYDNYKEDVPYNPYRNTLIL